MFEFSKTSNRQSSPTFLDFTLKRLYCRHLTYTSYNRSPFLNVSTTFWLTKVLFHKDDGIAAGNHPFHSTVPINKTLYRENLFVSP